MELTVGFPFLFIMGRKCLKMSHEHSLAGGWVCAQVHGCKPRSPSSRVAGPTFCRCDHWCCPLLDQHTEVTPCLKLTLRPLRAVPESCLIIPATSVLRQFRNSFIFFTQTAVL